MDRAPLALRHVRPTRGKAVFLSALLLAGCLSAGLLILRGVEASLRLAQEQLGADIVVVPAGVAGKAQAALLGDALPRIWMPDDTVARIKGVAGVAAAWPRLYLPALLATPSYPAEPPLIVFDPASDIALRPWLARHLPQGLSLGEAIAGSDVAAPREEATLLVYGCPITLIGRIDPTGTSLDHSLFITFEAAHDLARRSQTLAPRPLELPLSSISMAMVRVAPGRQPHDVALLIQGQMPGVVVAQGSDLFQGSRSRIWELRVLLQAIIGALGIMLSALLALVAALEVRHSPVSTAPRAGLPAALRPALAGAALGAALAGPAACAFRGYAAPTLDLPLLLPSPLTLAAVSGAALALGIAAAWWPMWQRRHAFTVHP